MPSTLLTSFSLRRLWDRISGPDLTRELEEAHREVIFYRTRLGAIIAGPAYLVSIFLYDYFYFPEKLFIGLCVGFFCAVLAASMYFFCKLNFAQKYYQLPLVIILAVTSNIAATVNLQLTGGGQGFFFFPYFLIFIAMTVYFPGTLKWVLSISISVIFSYSFSEWWVGTDFHSSQFTSNVIYLVLAAIFCIIGNRVFYTYFIREKNSQIELKCAYIQLQEAQGQIVQSEKLSTVGLLAAGIAHEIKNPAYAVTLNLANLETLKEELKTMQGFSEESQNLFARSLRRSQEEIERIKRIVNTLLTYSQKNREGVTLGDVGLDIESTLILLKNIMDGSGVAIHWDPTQTQGMRQVEADHGALNQVFTNLVQNAAQAGAKNITITAQEQGENLCVSVKDDGGGIPAAILPRIFEPFFTTKEVGQGTGLGLNIVHRIVKQHHGDVQVLSEEGKGTEFRVLIPFSPPIEKTK